MKKPNYRLTRAADNALDELFRSGAAKFGLSRAQGYLLDLHNVFEMLAWFPKAGRPFHEFRRHEHGGQIIFYVIEDDTVTIVDVIGDARDVEAWRKGSEGTARKGKR